MSLSAMVVIGFIQNRLVTATSSSIDFTPSLDSECYGSGLVKGVRISVHFNWQNLAQNGVEEKLDGIPCKIDQQGKSNHNIEKVASIPLEQDDFCFRRIV